MAEHAGPVQAGLNHAGSSISCPATGSSSCLKLQCWCPGWADRNETVSHHQSVLKDPGSFGWGAAAEKARWPSDLLADSERGFAKLLSLEAYIRSAVGKAIRACCPSEGAIPSSLIISQVKFTGLLSLPAIYQYKAASEVRAGWAVPALLELAEFECACWAADWVSAWFWCRGRLFEIRLRSELIKSTFLSVGTGSRYYCSQIWTSLVSMHSRERRKFMASTEAKCCHTNCTAVLRRTTGIHEPSRMDKAGNECLLASAVVTMMIPVQILGHKSFCGWKDSWRVAIPLALAGTKAGSMVPSFCSWISEGKILLFQLGITQCPC